MVQKKSKASPNSDDVKDERDGGIVYEGPPAIYLGARFTASSLPFLAGRNITHVLSVGINPSKKSPTVVYHRIALQDSDSANIAKAIREAQAFFDGIPKSPESKVFVHCAAGISRSPTIVTSYLMRSCGMTLREALGVVVRSRNVVAPRAHFLTYLQELDMELYGTVSFDADQLPLRREEKIALFESTEDADDASGQHASLPASRQPRYRTMVLRER